MRVEYSLYYDSKGLGAANVKVLSGGNGFVKASGPTGFEQTHNRNSQKGGKGKGKGGNNNHNNNNQNNSFQQQFGLGHGGGNNHNNHNHNQGNNHNNNWQNQNQWNNWGDDSAQDKSGTTSFGLPKSAASKMTPGDAFIRVRVPHQFIGQLIGPKGSNIKRLTKDYTVMMDVYEKTI